MIVVIPSVPHTGTSFVFHEVFKALPEGRNPKKSSHFKAWIHIYKDRIPELMSLWEYPWVIPLRHPLAVAATWKGRKKDLGLLEELWQQLTALERPGFYLSVDHTNRESQLKHICDSLNWTCETTWPVVASLGLREPLTDREGYLFERFIPFYELHSSVS